MATAETFARELEGLTTEQIYALVVLTGPTLSGRERDAILQVLQDRFRSTENNVDVQAAYEKLAEEKPSEIKAVVTVVVGSTQFGCWYGKGMHHGGMLQPAVAETPDDNCEKWTEEKNAHRRALIDKKIQRTITDEERAELEQLQQQAIAYRDQVAPLPIDAARRVHEELLKKKQEQDQEDE